MAQPEISVIIPAYNQARYLGASIQSVLDQTCPDYEIWVVDDGSTDQTKEVVQKFNDRRIHYIYQENRGLSGARNTGLKSAAGEFISFLDSDDAFLKNNLELLSAELRKDPRIGFTAGQTVYIDDDGNPLEGIMGGEPLEDNARFLLGNLVAVGSMLVRHTWLDKVGTFDETLPACEDWDMWLRLVKAGCKMKGIRQPVAAYRIHASQMTREADRMRKAALYVLDKFFNSNDLPQQFLDLRSNAYCRMYINIACREYRAGMIEDAIRDLEKAAELERSLFVNDYHEFLLLLKGWAFDTQVEHPDVFLATVFNNLPDSMRDLKIHQHQVLADIYATQTFKWHQEGKKSSAGRAACKAIYHQPGWAFNRGMISIILQSIIHRDAPAQ